MIKVNVKPVNNNGSKYRKHDKEEGGKNKAS
jgi:hypothetical protein